MLTVNLNSQQLTVGSMSLVWWSMLTYRLLRQTGGFSHVHERHGWQGWQSNPVEWASSMGCGSSGQKTSFDGEYVVRESQVPSIALMLKVWTLDHVMRSIHSHDRHHHKYYSTQTEYIRLFTNINTWNSLNVIQGNISGYKCDCTYITIERPTVCTEIPGVKNTMQTGVLNTYIECRKNRLQLTINDRE